MTRGFTVAEYRPYDGDCVVDIVFRFPSGDRTLAELESLRVPTSAGLVPISNFVSFNPAPRSGVITRIDQERVITVGQGTESLGAIDCAKQNSRARSGQTRNENVTPIAGVLDTF